MFVVEGAREYCQWENFNASCPGKDEVVLMTSARYGRIRFDDILSHRLVVCFKLTLYFFYTLAADESGSMSGSLPIEFHRTKLGFQPTQRAQRTQEKYATNVTDAADASDATAKKRCVRCMRCVG